MFDLEKITRANVKRLKPYASARDEYVSNGDAMTFLDANENPFENGLNRYPDPQQREVKTALSKQKNVSTDNILLGNGSDEVLDLIFRAFCEPQIDNIITLPPTYGMYKVLAEVNAVNNHEVLLSKDFQPDVSAILAKVNDKTKLIFICSPNNPTGNSFDQNRIATLLDRFEGLVVIDEAYIDFYKGDSWLSLLTKYPNLIVTQTLSKAYGMAGIRLGVCYASKAIIQILQKIKPPYNVNELTQQKALERIRKAAVVTAEITEIIAQRKVLQHTLKAMTIVAKVYPSDANFILVKVDDADKRYAQLLALGIVVRNRSKQPLCDNTLRLTVGTAVENKKLIKALKSLQ